MVVLILALAIAVSDPASDFEQPFDSLASMFITQAESVGCAGNIKVLPFSGPEEGEDGIALTLKTRAVVRLAECKSLRVIVEEGQKQEMIREIERMMAQSLFYRGDPSRLLGGYRIPEYQLSGGWTWETEGQVLRTTLELAEFKTGTRVVSKSMSMPDPQYVRMLEFKAKRRELISLVARRTGLGTGGFLLVLFGGLLMTRALQRRNLRRNLDRFTEQVEYLINERKFVAAEGFIKRGLKYDPGNPLILGLETKLEALSLGQPKKAQMAWELYDKMRSLMDNGKFEKAIILSPKADSLATYSPELKALTYQLEDKKNEEQRIEALNQKARTAERLKQDGKLNSALASLEAMATEAPDLNHVYGSLLEQVRSSIEKATAKYDLATRSLKNGEPREAKNSLQEALKLNSEYDEVSRLLGKLRDYEKITFVPDISGRAFHIFTKSAITIGRAQESDIVVQNPRVSGKHARVYIKGDAVVVEDLNSKNGTYVAGERVSKRAIEDGDIIELARSYRLVCKITTETAVEGRTDRTVSISRDLPKRAAGALLEAEEAYFVLLVGKMRISGLGITLSNRQGFVYLEPETGRKETALDGEAVNQTTGVTLLGGQSLLISGNDYRLEV